MGAAGLAGNKMMLIFSVADAAGFRSWGTWKQAGSPRRLLYNLEKLSVGGPCCEKPYVTEFNSWNISTCPRPSCTGAE